MTRNSTTYRVKAQPALQHNCSNLSEAIRVVDYYEKKGVSVTLEEHSVRVIHKTPPQEGKEPS